MVPHVNAFTSVHRFCFVLLSSALVLFVNLARVCVANKPCCSFCLERVCVCVASTIFCVQKSVLNSRWDCRPPLSPSSILLCMWILLFRIGSLRFGYAILLCTFEASMCESYILVVYFISQLCPQWNAVGCWLMAWWCDSVFAQCGKWKAFGCSLLLSLSPLSPQRLPLHIPRLRTTNCAPLCVLSP